MLGASIGTSKTCVPILLPLTPDEYSAPPFAVDEYLQLLRFLDVVAPEADEDRSDESREARRALAAEAARQRKRART